MHTVIPPHVMDPTLALVEPHQVSSCPTLQPVQVLLNGSTAFWCAIHSSQLCIISKLAETGLYPYIHVISEDISKTRPSINPWGAPLATGLQPDCVPLFTTL